MASSPQQGKRIYEFGPFRLDAAEHLLLCGGRRVPLTEKALDLLVELVQHAGHLVEKDALLEKVWKGDEVEEGIIANNISALRKALGDSKKSPRYIETVHGQGYRFIGEVREAQRVIVVLPFQSLSGVADGGRLGLGITFAVISMLDSMGIGGLIVRPRSAIIRYDMPNQDYLKAALEQDADYAVVGFFQQSGSRVRVDVDFLSVHDERKIWAKDFTVEMTDSLAVQQAAADLIAREVALHFDQEAADDRSRVVGNYTSSTRAYELYVEGRYQWNKFTRAGFREAINCFNKAIREDPTYAKAFVGISDCWTWLGIYSLRSPAEAFRRAEKWAEKALKINPELSGAYTSLGFIEAFSRRNQARASAYFERAIGLNKHNLKAHLGYALLLTGMKQFGRALEEIGKSLEIYSASPILRVTKAMILYEARQYDDALAQFDEALRLDEDFDAIYHGRALAYMQQGRYDMAVQAAKKAIEKSHNNLLNHTVLACAHAKRDAKVKARAVLRDVKKLNKGNRYVSPFHLATVYASLGDRRRAYGWLEQAREQRDPWYIWLHVEPRLDPLRSDPKFEDRFRVFKPLE